MERDLSPTGYGQDIVWYPNIMFGNHHSVIGDMMSSNITGDQLNANAICTEEAIKEALLLMAKREYYITGSGKFLYDPVVEPHLFLFRALSNGLR